MVHVGAANRPTERKMRRVDHMAKLIAFLLLGYFALTAVETFAFTFIWG
jgi:hypothetical protein